MSQELTHACAPGIAEAIEIIQKAGRGESVEEGLFRRMMQIIEQPTGGGPAPAGFVQLPSSTDNLMMRRVYRLSKDDLPWATMEMIEHVYDLFKSQEPHQREIALRVSAQQSEDVTAHSHEEDHEIEELVNAGMKAAGHVFNTIVPDVRLLPGLDYALQLCAHEAFGGSKTEMLDDLRTALDKIFTLSAASSEQNFVVMPITACYENLDDAVCLELRKEGHDILSDDLITLYDLFIRCRPHAPLFEDVCGDMFRSAWDENYGGVKWGHQPTAMSHFANGWYRGLRTNAEAQ